jgi:hypothetical protein
MSEIGKPHTKVTIVPAEEPIPQATPVPAAPEPVPAEKEKVPA